MRPGKRFGFSAIEKSDIWSRWKAGQSLHELGRDPAGSASNVLRFYLLQDAYLPRRSR